MVEILELLQTEEKQENLMLQEQTQCTVEITQELLLHSTQLQSLTTTILKMESQIPSQWFQLHLDKQEKNKLKTSYL